MTLQRGLSQTPFLKILPKKISNECSESQLLSLYVCAVSTPWFYLCAWSEARDLCGDPHTDFQGALSWVRITVPPENIHIRTKPIILIHEALCDWPLPACLIFPSSFLLFAQVTADFLLVLGDQKPSLFLPLGVRPGYLLCLESWAPMSFRGCSFSL